jgi:predicted DNA-binding protein YlxM (UPF0122 family)
MKRTKREQAYDIWKSIEFEDSATTKARKHKNRETTRAHYKKLGDRNVELGVMVERGINGGKSRSPKKIKKLLELNKTKRELTDEQVLQMKELYKNDLTIGLPELAEKYGVSGGAIRMALTGETYSEVGEHLELREPLIKCTHCKELQTKGNYTRWHGEACNLKGIDVDGIVSEYKAGGISKPKLAKKWGLTMFKITSILKNK